MQVITRSSEETRMLGEALGRLLRPGDVLGVSGPMGAGKTVFAQGLASGLEVDEPVNSPTFALVHQYEGRVPVWHLDTYRVESPDELMDLSWQDLLRGGGVVIVEWPERIAAAMPADRLDVHIRPRPAAEEREFALAATGPRMDQVLERLSAQLRGAAEAVAG